MKRFILCLPIIFAAATVRAASSSSDDATVMVSSPGAQALTLKQCFDLALDRSENLKIQEETIRQAEAQYSQALGSILPNLRWNATRLIQDTSGTETTGESGVQNTLTLKHRDESKFVIQQPIFQGFREFSAMRGFKFAKESEKLLLRRATITLFLDVSRAFYTVLELQTQLRNLETELNFTKDRIDELEGRAKLGKSRDSEVLSAQAQYSVLKSQEERRRGAIVVAREILAFLIGRDVTGTILIDIVERPTKAPELPGLLEMVASRSDLEALRSEVQARHYAVRVARAGYWPSLGVVGNYYTKRVGFQEPIDWDMLFNLDVPIFQGGTVHALSKEAISQMRQTELSLERESRQAESDVRSALSNLVYSINETGLLEDAYHKVRRSYEAQRKEYRLGLVNNLDVLQSLTVMQDIKQQWDDSIILSKLAWINLKATVEDLPR